MVDLNLGKILIISCVSFRKGDYHYNMLPPVSVRSREVACQKCH